MDHFRLRQWFWSIYELKSSGPNNTIMQIISSHSLPVAVYVLKKVLFPASDYSSEWWVREFRREQKLTCCEWYFFLFNPFSVLSVCVDYFMRNIIYNDASGWNNMFARLFLSWKYRKCFLNIKQTWFFKSFTCTYNNIEMQFGNLK